MNTGIQQSSATPFGASTSTTPAGRASRGKTTGSKNMPLVMAMHDIPYVATATLSHLEDYAKKLVKAKEAAKEGFAYIHVFCPCVVGWKIPVDCVDPGVPGRGEDQLLPAVGDGGRRLPDHPEGQGPEAGRAN